MSYSTPSNVGLTHVIHTRGDYTITTDPTRLDVDAIYAYLSRSYWAHTRPREILELTLRHSLNYGVYHSNEHGESQVGFARIVTDYGVFAYLNDLYILEEHRWNDVGTWLMQTILDDPILKDVILFTLATSDAHDFYAAFGFTSPKKPQLLMERLRPRTQSA